MFSCFVSQPLLDRDEAAGRASNPATVPVDATDVAIVGTSASIQSQKISFTRTASITSQTSSASMREKYRIGVADPEDAARPLYKKDALYTGSNPQLKKQSRTSLNGSNPYLASAADIPAAVKADKSNDSAIKAFADILVAMTDLSILKNKQMLIICIGNVFSMLGYYLPIMCLVSFASEDMHVDQTTASYLMTIFGTKNKISTYSFR
jgi:hypothetical protein